MWSKASQPRSSSIEKSLLDTSVLDVEVLSEYLRPRRTWQTGLPADELTWNWSQRTIDSIHPF